MQTAGSGAVSSRCPLPVATTNYSYDECGNRTVKDEPGAAITYYGWDDRNRLAVVEPPGGPVNFTYDADCRLVKKEVGGDTINFIYDYKKVLQESDGADTTTNLYTNLIDEYGDLISQYDGTSSSYHEFDALGSTNALTNPAQATTDAYVHKAFGEVVARTGTDDNPNTYVGKQNYYWDEHIFLYYVTPGSTDGRLYDPYAGGWIHRDYVGIFGGHVNFVCYVGNNPVNQIDPSGKDDQYLTDEQKSKLFNFRVALEKNRETYKKARAFHAKVEGELIESGVNILGLGYSGKLGPIVADKFKAAGVDWYPKEEPLDIILESTTPAIRNYLRRYGSDYEKELANTARNYLRQKKEEEARKRQIAAHERDEARHSTTILVFLQTKGPGGPLSFVGVADKDTLEDDARLLSKGSPPLGGTWKKFYFDLANAETLRQSFVERAEKATMGAMSILGGLSLMGIGLEIPGGILVVGGFEQFTSAALDKELASHQLTRAIAGTITDDVKVKDDVADKVVQVLTLVQIGANVAGIAGGLYEGLQVGIKMTNAGAAFTRLGGDTLTVELAGIGAVVKITDVSKVLGAAHGVSRLIFMAVTSRTSPPEFAPSANAPAKVAPAEKVVNHLKEYKSKKYQVGSDTFQLDKAGMKHILERHHPEFWDGTTKAQQSFLNRSMTTTDIEDIISVIMRDNRALITQKGTASIFQLPPTQVNGVRYVVGINEGRIAQFYPIVP